MPDLSRRMTLDDTLTVWRVHHGLFWMGILAFAEVVAGATLAFVEPWAARAGLWFPGTLVGLAHTVMVKRARDRLDAAGGADRTGPPGPRPPAAYPGPPPPPADRPAQWP